MDPNSCRRQCDCHHPGECYFNRQVAPERPSFVVAWIVGAGAVAMAIVILRLVF